MSFPSLDAESAENVFDLLGVFGQQSPQSTSRHYIDAYVELLRFWLSGGVAKGACLMSKALLDVTNSPEPMTEQYPSTGETALHLAVRHGLMEVAKLLIKRLKVTPYLNDVLNRKDYNGDTVLHLATSRKQLKILNFLLEDGNMHMVDINAIKDCGLTVLDMPCASKRGEIGKETQKTLPREGGLKGVDQLKHPEQSNHQVLNIGWNNERQLPPLRTTSSEFLIRLYQAVLISATLLATTTYTASLRLPAGNHQTSNDLQVGQRDAVNHLFVWFNSIAFFISVALITVLTHELPIKPVLLVLVSSTTGAYVCSIVAVSPHQVATVLFIGSSILSAAFLKCSELHKTVLKYSKWLCTRIPVIQNSGVGLCKTSQ